MTETRYVDLKSHMVECFKEASKHKAQGHKVVLRVPEGTDTDSLTIMHMGVIDAVEETK